jgi:CheY-like chemotaxis protein
VILFSQNSIIAARRVLLVDYWATFWKRTQPKSRAEFTNLEPHRKTRETEPVHTHSRKYAVKHRSTDSVTPLADRVVGHERDGEEGSSPPLGVATAILALTRDATARDLLMEIASERGYGLYCATDGGEAIQLLGTEPPALVVLDIDTPDGRAVLRALRAEERWRGIPLFALTATNNPMATVTIDAPVFFKPDLGGLEEAVLGRFESAEHELPSGFSDLGAWTRRKPSA